MFTILIILGTFIIVLGIVKNKNQSTRSIVGTESISSDNIELHELSERVEHIENILFYHTPQLPEEEEELKSESIPVDIDDSITYERVAKSVASPIPQGELDISNKALEKFKLLCKYEKENYEIDEICVLLNMKKGEVLLLKNLYKALLT